MRNLPLLLLTACAVPAQQPEPLAAERALADFSEPGEGSRWRTVLDGVMGGRSTGSFEVRDGRMVFTGVLNTNGGGFSSVRGAADWTSASTANRRAPARPRRRPQLHAAAAAADGAAALRGLYRTQFETRAGDSWQDVYVPYSALRPTWRGRDLDLPPVDPSKVDELGVSIDDKIDGPFRIEIQQIRTYGAFDRDALRDERRPLVVFMANAQDPRAVQQLATAQRDADGFAEREITLVVVYEDGAAFAGARQLSVRTAPRCATGSCATARARPTASPRC